MTRIPGTLRLLLVSTPVGPIGTGAGGGVELTIRNAARELLRRGHRVHIVAPAGSRVEGVPLTEVAGTAQPYAQYQGRDTPIVMPAAGVLEAMWLQVGRMQGEYDLILNFAYDWLPLYLTQFLRTPVAHLLSMGSLTDAMDGAIAAVAHRFPLRLAVHTRVQGETFPVAALLRVVGNGFDLSLYPFNAQPERRLCWVGRIAPEKGLEDAVEAAAAAGLPLHVCGTLQDEPYWQSIAHSDAGAGIHYRGFLATPELAAVVGGSAALLMTPKWVEALGNVAIEALACGTPVIAYRRGGPAEIIEHGRTGLLVTPDSVPGLVGAVRHLDTIDRAACRTAAEAHHSLAAFGDRLETWFAAILSGRPAYVAQ